MVHHSHHKWDTWFSANAGAIDFKWRLKCSSPHRWSEDTERDGYVPMLQRAVISSWSSLSPLRYVLLLRIWSQLNFAGCSHIQCQLLRQHIRMYTWTLVYFSNFLLPSIRSIRYTFCCLFDARTKCIVRLTIITWHQTIIINSNNNFWYFLWHPDKPLVLSIEVRTKPCHCEHKNQLQRELHISHVWSQELQYSQRTSFKYVGELFMKEEVAYFWCCVQLTLNVAASSEFQLASNESRPCLRGDKELLPECTTANLLLTMTRRERTPRTTLHLPQRAMCALRWSAA